MAETQPRSGPQTKSPDDQQRRKLLLRRHDVAHHHAQRQFIHRTSQSALVHWRCGGAGRSRWRKLRGQAAAPCLAPPTKQPTWIRPWRHRSVRQACQDQQGESGLQRSRSTSSTKPRSRGSRQLLIPERAGDGLVTILTSRVLCQMSITETLDLCRPVVFFSGFI